MKVDAVDAVLVPHKRSQQVRTVQCEQSGRGVPRTGGEVGAFQLEESLGLELANKIAKMNFSVPDLDTKLYLDN